VLRADGSVLAEGPLDTRGVFIFAYQSAEPLLVQITAPGGHGKDLKIPADALNPASTSDTESSNPSHARMVPNSSTEERWRSLIAGLGFLLALWAFVQGWLNARRLRRLEERWERSSEQPLQ
jgi:hypothetical protein